MKITVHLYGAFRKEGANPSFPYQIEESATVGDLMNRLGLPDPVYRMALIGNLRVGESTPLQPGDEVHLFQPIGGG